MQTPQAIGMYLVNHIASQQYFYSLQDRNYKLAKMKVITVVLRSFQSSVVWHCVAGEAVPTFQRIVVPSLSRVYQPMNSHNGQAVSVM